MTDPKTLIRATLVVLAASVLSACASKPDPNSFGGRLLQEGGDVASIGERWNDGQAMIAEGREMIEDGEDEISAGRKLIKRGESRIDDGETQIARGKRLVADGERTVADAERSYNNRINIPQNVPAPPVVLPQGATY